ncbi:MAG: hypothetical protein K2N72_12255 [Oscillospiraceae bacterium]|nr:hypothetical protein [Oscillospiraceae bacterium]
MSDRNANYAGIMECAAIIFLAVLLGCMLFLRFSFNEKDAAPKIFGFTVYQTHSLYMEPKIPNGTVILAKETETGSISRGSVVLCRLEEAVVLTRVVGVENENGIMTYEVQFDNGADSFKISEESIMAKAVGQSAQAGSVLGFVDSASGNLCMILIFFLILFVFGMRIRRKSLESVTE